MAKKLLTNKKKAWAKQFKPTAALRGKPLAYNVSVQKRYIDDMQALMSDIIAETEKAIKGIYASEAAEEFFTEDASIASQSRISLNKLTSKAEALVAAKAKSMAERMIGGTDKTSKSSLHSSLKELSGGLSIKTDIYSSDIAEAITSSINANVDLIKTIPAEYLAKVKGAVNRSIQSGTPDLVAEIEGLLTKESRKMLNKAKNVALDQTRKAYTAINKARMEKVGVTEFEWIHSGGSREPRKKHITRFPNGLNGGIFSINDPPVIDDKTGERGLPGQLINCRCVMRPIIRFDEGEPV